MGDFARRIFERFDDKQILVIGAGEMAEETLRYLLDEGARQITIINRSLERAELLAARSQGVARPWGDLDDALVAADVIVATTGAPMPVVSLARYRSIEPARYQRDLFVLDLAVPRDFEPAIGDSLGVYLYSSWLPARSSRKKRPSLWPSCITAPPGRSSNGCGKVGSNPKTTNYAGCSTGCPTSAIEIARKSANRSIG